MVPPPEHISACHGCAQPLTHRSLGGGVFQTQMIAYCFVRSLPHGLMLDTEKLTLIETEKKKKKETETSEKEEQNSGKIQMEHELERQNNDLGPCQQTWPPHETGAETSSDCPCILQQHLIPQLATDRSFYFQAEIPQPSRTVDCKRGWPVMRPQDRVGKSSLFYYFNF